MEILGIGPLELFFIVIIALLILGPKDMIKAGRTIGNTLRKIVTSSSWRSVQSVSKEIKHLPNKLMREAGLEDIENELGVKEINKEIKEIQHDISDWTTPIPMSMEPIENKGKSEKTETPPAPDSVPESEPATNPTSNS